MPIARSLHPMPIQPKHAYPPILPLAPCLHDLWISCSMLTWEAHYPGHFDLGGQVPPQVARDALAVSLWPEAVSLWPEAVSLWPEAVSLWPEAVSLWPEAVAAFAAEYSSKPPRCGLKLLALSRLQIPLRTACPPFSRAIPAGCRPTRRRQVLDITHKINHNST